MRGVRLAIKYKVETRTFHLEPLVFETLQLPCPGPGVLGPQSSFSQNQQNGKLKRKGAEDPVRAGERKTSNFQKCPRQSCFLMHNAHNFFFFYLQKNTIIINPNKDDTQFAATFPKRFGRRVFTSRQPGLTPASSHRSFQTAFPSHSKKQGVMIHGQQHAKVKQEKMVQNRNYYHTCPACRINIFNADFRIFSI